MKLSKNPIKQMAEKWLASALVSAAMLVCASASRAGIIGVTNWTYDTSLNGLSLVFDTSPHLGVVANQSGLAGQMGGTILANSIEDPTLTMSDSINNDSGFAWSAYVLDVSMSVDFSLAVPANPFANPSDWSGTISTAPHYDSVSGQYIGEIVFSGATPVSPVDGDLNNILDFMYKITFAGSSSYTLTQQFSAIPVPEPGALSLMAAGSLVLGGWTMGRRRKSSSAPDGSK